MAAARIFALLSALSSLFYLACLPTIPILLFIDWRIAIALVPIAFTAAILAKVWNRKKLQAVFGKAAGAFLNEIDWATGRRL
jgi:hypothetical protein